MNLALSSIEEIQPIPYHERRMKLLTPITLFAVGVSTLFIGGALGYVVGYNQGFERSDRNVPPTNQIPPPFGRPPQNFVECAANGNPVMESYPRQCRAENGQLFVEEIPDLTPPPTPSNRACAPAGCSNQLCVDADKAAETVTTCEFRDSYACYRTARCERQTTGACGWTQTDTLTACLQNPPPLQ